MTVSQSRAASGRRQGGISLVVVMILLVITALLGIAILRSAMMQERMSANVRDRSLAFQAAEAALRYAQADVLGGAAWDITPPAPGAACTADGVCPTDAAAAWKEVPLASYNFANAGLEAAPEYWIEYIGTGPAIPGGCDVVGPEDVSDINCVNPIYRITARSRSEGRADVVIQASVMSRLPDLGI
ncbi:pilus assembly PilX family protein [Luteimonas terrae]|uniref:Type IV pilus assembly protein PilX n=1 Tax=Luteimonas terrae TaxID=1530191 RepID=A0ABU1XSC0_9GAMM|nr:PilX N-terminal domain-containing pilus assembly protein [Luteimonas terrae]MDR7191488.1 type IV pilus assembly protein PilX [Luteimonas terrae]